MDIIRESARIAIRNIKLTDVPLFVSWWNDGSLMSSVGFKHGLGITEEELVAEFRDELADTNPFRERRRYVIINRFSKIPIGELVYGRLDIGKKQCGLGIKICEVSLQGIGLGQETLITFMNYLFEHFNLNRIEIDSIHDNIRALSLYKKLGFLEFNKFDNYWTDPEGIPHDLIFLGMDRMDWRYF